ncbi:MAG: hypothetical protein IKL03_08365 [Bacteroidaceae bacterium]|nr:hypothetical protein [Bacteroidaceae bacterium]
MEEKRLRDMIERFFNAELTAEEELTLCRYLYANDVPVELRTDREVIIALCGTLEEAALPEGATERLEAMLDGLEADAKGVPVTTAAGLSVQRSIFHALWSKYLLRAACAAAVVVAVFLAIPYGDDKHTDEGTTLAMVDDVDKDTFDNPEEAMQCFMEVYNDIMLAMNTARDNTHEVHQALTQSVMINLNLFKLEPTKNREL